MKMGPILKPAVHMSGMTQPSIKIYTAADIHGHEDRLERISHHITTLKPDLFVIAGDITGRHGPDPDIRRLNDLPIPVLTVRGNMDPPEMERLIESYPNIISLHQREWIIKGVTFVGLGGTLPIPFNARIAFREKSTTETLGDLVKADSVLVVHTPPYGTLDEGFGNIHTGSRGLRRLILEKQPRMLICGHIHAKPGWAFIDKTLVVNCSMGQRGAGALIVLTGNNKPAVRML